MSEEHRAQQPMSQPSIGGREVLCLVWGWIVATNDSGARIVASARLLHHRVRWRPAAILLWGSKLSGEELFHDGARVRHRGIRKAKKVVGVY